MVSSIPQKFGFVTLCGLPNAGKSTLLNRIAGRKLAAVSPKAQTTRTNTLFVCERDEAQIAFTDTPGLLRPQHPLDSLLRKNARSAIKGADVLLFLIDLSARTLDPAEKLLEQMLGAQGFAPLLLAFNKIDRLKPHEIVARAAPFQEHANVRDFFMISAEKGAGLQPLLSGLISVLPNQPWLYPPQSNPTADLQRWASELTLEQLFRHLQNEIPYQSYVTPVHFTEDADGLHFFQNIIVAKPSQKAVVIGNKGQMLRTIGQAARLTIAKALRRRVHLQLFVKVFPDWVRSQTALRDAGLSET